MGRITDATSSTTRGSAARVAAWGLLACCVVAALLMVVAASAPGGFLVVTFVLLPALAVAGIAGVVAIVIAIRQRRLPVALVIGPVVLVAVCVLAATGVVQQSAFTLAQPALDRVAATGECPEWAGPLPVADCWSDGGVTFVTVRDAGFLNATGYAFVPDGATPQSAEGDGPQYDGAMGGGWFEFRFEW